MDLSKHRDVFDPATMVPEEINIIGCGAIGSTIAELFARLGIEAIRLFDFDRVTAYNVTNQMFYPKQIDLLKVDALESILHQINPEMKVQKFNKGYTEHTALSGYVFLCVDSIELRKAITERFKDNPRVKCISDCRMDLFTAQHYFAAGTKEIEKMLKTMDFTDTEADENTPVSPCGSTLSITPTVRSITALCVANFINYLQGKPYKTVIIDYPFNAIIDAFK